MKTNRNRNNKIINKQYKKNIANKMNKALKLVNWIQIKIKPKKIHRNKSKNKIINKKSMNKTLK